MMKPVERFDLTTAAGVNAVIGILNDKRFWFFNPTFWILKKIFETFDSGKTAQKQAQAAEALIRTGRESGVKVMEITMDQQAGLNLDIPIEGVKINTMAGTKGKVTIKVEYR